MSVQSQKRNMKAIYDLVSQDLSYIHGEREGGPNGAKKVFHTKTKAFMRALGKDLEFTEFKVANYHGGIAVSGEITLKGVWGEANGLYFQITQPLQPFNSFLYRSIAHLKDSPGGMNQWLPCSLFRSGDYEGLLEALLAMKDSPAPGRGEGEAAQDHAA